jgi:Fe-Mn family superoxide dismutase
MGGFFEMLHVYGSMLPVRILEEILFWKTQEKQHTEFIKVILPNLEDPYVQLLDEWAVFLGATEQTAQKLLDSTLSPSPLDLSELTVEIENLLDIASTQSHEFVRQLSALQEDSAEVKAVPLSVTVILQIIRESQYFLAELETFSSPGKLSQIIRAYTESSVEKTDAEDIPQ